MNKNGFMSNIFLLDPYIYLPVSSGIEIIGSSAYSACLDGTHKAFSIDFKKLYARKNGYTQRRYSIQEHPTEEFKEEIDFKARIILYCTSITVDEYPKTDSTLKKKLNGLLTLQLTYYKFNFSMCP